MRWRCLAIIRVTNDMWEERTDSFQTPLTDVSVLTFLPSHLLNCPDTNDDARDSLRNYFIPFEIELTRSPPVTSFCLLSQIVSSVEVKTQS